MTKSTPPTKSKQKYSYAERLTHVLNFNASGLKKIDYCHTHNISTSALYRWIKEIGKQDANAKPANFTQVKSESQRVAPVKTSTSAQLQIKLGKLELLIPAGFDVEHTARLLKELSAC